MNKNINAGSAGMTGPRITPDMLKLAKNVECSCGGIIFRQALVFKKISAILSPSGKEEILPIDVIVCEKCQKVNRTLLQYDILPEEVMERPQIVSSLMSNQGTTNPVSNRPSTLTVKKSSDKFAY
jgi:hypothetical protein